MIILTDKMLVIPVGISPNYAGAGNSDIKLQTKEVTITENGSTTVVPDENFDGFTKVNITTNVNPALEDKNVEITANGDYNYTASAPYYGIGNFNVKVNVQWPVESSKTVNPSFVEDVTVTPSEGFDAMSSVIVKKAVANLQDKTVDKASESQIVLTADEGYQGLGTVTIAPIKTTTHTVIPSSNQQLITADPNNNEYISEVLVNGVPQKTLTADPSTNEQTFNSNHSSGEFYSKVVVNPVTSSIDSNIVPEYIAKGVSILGVTGNLEAGSTPSTPTEAYAIRPTSGRIICPFTNVLLNETSWVSLDFAMDTSSLNKEKAVLFGISASSLHCYLNNGVLHMYTGEEVPFNKQITLDTNKHTLEFGFVSKADASGHATFKVVFDGEVVADVMVLVPKFNLPLSLFDVPNAYDGTYDDYIAGGGITYIVNGTGYGAGDSVFDLFALTVYDKPGYYRQTINAYTPSLDASNKPIFIDNITGEYQYPASGTYSYSKIDGDTRTEIASASYTMPFSNDFQYFRASEGAIVPTDIELPALHKITMYVKDIDNFDGGTSDSALDNVKNRAMIGAQPTLVSPFNHIDYEKGLPWLDINEENTAILADASGGIYYKVVDHFGYSILTEYGGTPQKLTSFSGEHIIKCGVRREGNASMWKTTSIDSDGESQYLWQGKVPDKLNNFNLAPLCIFGTYNEVEGTNPDYVNSLGYQEALNQIGYKTGVRYAVKQIDIEEYDIVQEGGNIIDKTFLRHRLVTHTDNNGVNCLFDTITGTSYYPYNGTLDVYTSPVEPEPEPDPEPPVPPTILTDTYVKPSAGAIVPTDIKFTSLTNVKMYVKGFDNVKLPASNMDSRAMIGAQPNFIVSPFRESSTTSDKIGIYFNGCGNVLRSTDGKNPQTIKNNVAQVIRVGYIPKGSNINMDTDRTMLKIINFSRYSSTMISKEVGPTSTGIYQFVDNQATTPICIFGNYNNPESMTPDDVIALGYENALSQIGYVTGVRYGVTQIVINVYNADGSETTTHSLVPARDSNGTICLYDTITEKSYYPFHGTLDII